MSACSATRGNSTAPPAPCPDDKVAEELETMHHEGYEDFWTWMDKIYKLLDQTAIARGDDPC